MTLKYYYYYYYTMVLYHIFKCGLHIK